MASGPRECENKKGPSEHPPKFPIPGTSSGGAAVTVPQYADSEDEEQWLFSLTRRLEALGPIPYKLPEGWVDFDDTSFTLMLHDALHAVGLEPDDLPSEWTTLVTKKTIKVQMPKLPKVPRLFLGKMFP